MMSDGDGDGGDDGGGDDDGGDDGGDDNEAVMLADEMILVISNEIENTSITRCFPMSDCTFFTHKSQSIPRIAIINLSLCALTNKCN